MSWFSEEHPILPQSPSLSFFSLMRSTLSNSPPPRIGTYLEAPGFLRVPYILHGYRLNHRILSLKITPLAPNSLPPNFATTVADLFRDDEMQHELGVIFTFQRGSVLSSLVQTRLGFREYPEVLFAVLPLGLPSDLNCFKSDP